MKLLLIEDDEHLAWTVKTSLAHSGYTVDWVTNGIEGQVLAGTYTYDVILLDIMLPGQDGFTTCKSIRSTGSKTPILILTARSREDDRVRGLDFGADDYLVKPFSYPELFARIRALVRRTKNVFTSELKAGQLLVNTTSKEVSYDGKPLILTAKEYAVIEYLALNKNCIVTKQMLEQQLWNCDSGAFSNVIEVLVSRIRKKCRPDDKEAVIRTVKGLGYAIRDPQEA